MNINNNSNSNQVLYERIQAIQMSESERSEARAALATAERLVAAVFWLVAEAKGLFGHRGFTPSLKH